MMRASFFLLFSIISTSARADWSVRSPDGSIELRARLNEAGSLLYEARLDGEILLAPAHAGLRTSLADGLSGLRERAHSTREASERITLPSGKARSFVSSYRELALDLEKNGQVFRFLARASNDGVAYRWEMPETKGAFQVYWEEGGYAVLPHSTTWGMKYWHEEYSYETAFEKKTIEERSGWRMAAPILTLARGKAERWTLLFEAAPEAQYTGAHFLVESNGLLRLQPDAADARKGLLHVASPFRTPWRAAILARNLGAVVESNLPVALGPETVRCGHSPCDFSWVEPGLASWSWFSGRPVNDFATTKEFIDVAALFGWKYYLADLGWQESWMPEIIRYAASKGVGILLWSEYQKLEDPLVMETTLAKWASWGAKGIKIDFFNSERQEIQALYERILESAARHRLNVNFHGTSSKLATLQRKWPHLLTTEAIYGEEQRIWGTGPDAVVHNTVFPYTRNVLGSMDSTLAPFYWRKQETLAHLTALTILHESGIGHFADTYFHYALSPARPLFQQLPAAWDETRFVSGYPNDSAVLARRNGDDWYVGAIVSTARKLEIPLRFLPKGFRGYAQIYSDGKDGSEIVLNEVEVRAGQKLTLRALDRGGAAIRISKEPLSQELRKGPPIRWDILVKEKLHFSGYPATRRQ